MSPSESGQQVSRLRELSEAAANEPQYPRGPWPTSVVLELIDIAEQEHAAREAAEQVARHFEEEFNEAHGSWQRRGEELKAVKESFHRYEERAHVAEMKLERAREYAEKLAAVDATGRYMAQPYLDILDSPTEGETT